MARIYSSYHFKIQNNLIKLIVAITGIYLLYIILKFFFFLFNASSVVDAIYNFFTLPANLGKLIFRPWTIFTYIFIHTNFWHFFINLIVLYFSGVIFLLFFDDKQLWRVFVISGLVGGLVFVLSYNIFPAFTPMKDYSYLLGASAGITGLIVASATYRPNYTVLLFGIFPMPQWIFAIIFVLIDIASVPISNSGGHLAHLGGAIYGFYWGLKIRSGRDVSAWLSNISFKKKYRPRMRVHKNDFRPQDYQWNYDRKNIQKEIDRILEKIAKHGYNSLTKKEREFLKKHRQDY